MSNKNMLIVFLISNLFLSPIIFCKELCDLLRDVNEEDVIDSALTLDDKVYLFQNQEIWLFYPKLNSTPTLIGKIGDNFDSTVVDSGQTYNLERMDAITPLPIHQKGNQNEDRLRLIFANYGRRYWFYIFGKCKEQNRHEKCFRRLQPIEKHYIPPNMEYTSGRLFDWFPNKYDDLLALNEYLFIFFNRSTQVVKLPNNMNDKWDNDPGIISFGGDMQSVEKIDAVFEMPLSEDIVFVKSDKYCRFNRNHLLSAVYIKSFLEISCQWTALSALLNCSNLTNSFSSKQTITDETESERYTTNSTFDSNSIIIIIIFIIVVFFIAISFFLVLITFFIGVGNKNKSPSRQVRSNKSGLNMKTRSDPDTWASVATVDSRTGKKLQKV